MLEGKVILIILIAYFLQISLTFPYFGGCGNDRNSLGFNNIPDAPYWDNNLRVPDFGNSAHYKSSYHSQNGDSSEVQNNTIYATMEKSNSADSASKESPEHKSIADIINSKGVDNSYPCQKPEYPQINRAEIVVHRPAPIIVKRPPTKVIIRHPPLVVKPSPVIFHRPPPKVIRPVLHNIYPQNIKVEPILVKVKKPLKKVYVKSSLCSEEHFTRK